MNSTQIRSEVVQALHLDLIGPDNNHAFAQQSEQVQKEVAFGKNLDGPPLKSSFDEIFNAISSQHENRTPRLVTTGGVEFKAGEKR